MAQKHQHFECPQLVALFIVNLCAHILEFLVQSLISCWTLNEVLDKVLTILEVPVRGLVPNLQTLEACFAEFKFNLFNFLIKMKVIVRGRW